MGHYGGIMGYSNRPGYFQGRHFTSYVQQIKNLMKQSKFDVAEKLLRELVAATEAESKVENSGVAPWFFEELAKIYIRQKEYEEEVNILKRFA
jgi:hypothetical protein